MIALLNGLPLMVKPSGEAVGFRREWLRAALKRAADRAGCGGWFPAREMTIGVSLYLEQCYELNIIGVHGLEALVRKALCDLGYEEVARVFGSRGRGDQTMLNFS